MHAPHKAKSLRLGSTWTTGLIIAAAGAVAFVAIARRPAADNAAAAPAATTKAPKQVAADTPLTPLFATPEKAEPPGRLLLLCDNQQLIGWFDGQLPANSRVQIEVDGAQTSFKPNDDGSFVWPYKVNKPQTAVVKLSGRTKRIRLQPYQEKSPTVFFVVDRTVYRPGHVVKFAGFLRQRDINGVFQPLPQQDVEVTIKSVKKKTAAATLKLQADEAGRINGQYQFQAADALDDYTLEIAGYKGHAQVKLAEFRKAKVRLKIEDSLDGNDLKLRFQAVDFLDAAVAGSKVHFQATIVKANGSSRDLPLDASEFAYSSDLTAEANSLEHASDDARLLWKAGLIASPPAISSLHAVAGRRSADVVLDDKGFGQHTLKLDPAWTRGAYSVQVTGVLVDYNGREQRSSRTISIGTEVKDCDLELNLAKTEFQTGEKIRLAVKPLDAEGQPVNADASLVVMKLSPAQQQHLGYGYGYGYYNRFNYFSRAQQSRGFSPYFLRYNASGHGVISDLQPPKTSEREMVTAVVVHNGVAEFEIEEPGPYKLVCVAKLPDGRTLKNEVGCIVANRGEASALILKVDDDLLNSGGRLRGELHSSLAGGRVMLSLRDSVGLRWWKILDLPGGAARFDVQLPKGVQYGCTLQAQQISNRGELRYASQFIRVTPVERMMQVSAKTAKVYSPGDDAVIDIQVDRQEQVDLVVSVYDQSLLGIAADKSVDVRNFYLADETVRSSAAISLLAQRLSGVTVRDLVERAKDKLKHYTATEHPQVNAALTRLTGYYYNSHRINTQQLITLLQIAGIEARRDAFNANVIGSSWHHRFEDWEAEQQHPATVTEVLGSAANTWILRMQYIEDVLMIEEYTPNPSYARYFNGAYRQQYAGQLQQRAGGYGLGRARGDAHFSLSGNSFASAGLGGMVSGQSFISHLPAPSAPILQADASAGSVRRNFSDSAFFNAQVRTDKKGHASVRFKLPDSLTNWRVKVTAVSRSMHVGQQTASFRTFKPVMIWPMIPRTFTEGDIVQLYGSVHNQTSAPQKMTVKLKVENAEILSPAERTVTVQPKSNTPVYWTFKAGKHGFTQLLMSATCDAGSDASLKRLPVVRMAGERVVSSSGFISKSGELTVPAEVNLDDAQFEIKVSPSLADDMVQSLDYLVQYPYGCVEQTMSRFLPAIKVSQILSTSGIKNPSLEKKLPGVVEAGVKRLLELQKPDGGWGWQSNSATHEMMTPYALYGLLQARQAGYTIPNEPALQRGMSRLRRFINGMGQAQAADRIYCMYVYTHQEKADPKWWEFIDKQHKENHLSDYALALALEMVVRQADNPQLAGRLAASLTQRATVKNGDAYWTTAGFSRWGNDRNEITAAALKALVAYDKDHALTGPVLSFFARTKRGNRWNSTKDTAMIIYAMCDYLAAQDYRPGGDRTIAMRVNGGEPVELHLSSGKTTSYLAPASAMKHGVNRVEFSGNAPGALYRATFRWWENSRDIKPLNQGLTVTRTFNLIDDIGATIRQIQPGDTIPRGSYILSRVTVQSEDETAMQFLLVENAKPSCCEIVPVTDPRFKNRQTRHSNVLREEKTAGVVWHHESTGRNVTDQCVYHAELAGEYVLKPARAELMYSTEHFGHSGGFHFKIADEAPTAK